MKLSRVSELPSPMECPAPGWFKNPAECTAQMDDAGAILSRLASRQLVECQQGAASTRMSVLYLDAMRPISLPLPQTYSSFEACMKFKPAAAAREQRQAPLELVSLVEAVFRAGSVGCGAGPFY